MTENALSDDGYSSDDDKDGLNVAVTAILQPQEHNRDHYHRKIYFRPTDSDMLTMREIG